jgi:hypothetical protein
MEHPVNLKERAVEEVSYEQACTKPIGFVLSDLMPELEWSDVRTAGADP